MTEKQKLKSLKKKLQTIQNRNPNFDFDESCRIIADITVFYKIRQEAFLLEFEINHCKTCGKKL